jgi:hypothetical protein
MLPLGNNGQSCQKEGNCFSARSTVSLLDYIIYVEFFNVLKWILLQTERRHRKSVIRHECCILSSANLSTSIESGFSLQVSRLRVGLRHGRSACSRLLPVNINYRSCGVSLSLVRSAG